jgi:hypothetical protein
MGFIWDPHGEAWEIGFNALCSYKKMVGDCLVPTAWQTTDNFKLGSWVTVQRNKRNALSADRTYRLNEIGFVWDTSAAKWQTGFNALLSFQSQEGHCFVPHYYFVGKFNLGAWVASQRKNRNKIGVEQQNKLNAIGFIWDITRDKPNV